MPQVGFEPTIPVFERTKTVHALDRHYDRQELYHLIIIKLELRILILLLKKRRSQHPIQSQVTSAVL
jgi:hypothetical protein